MNERYTTIPTTLTRFSFVLQLWGLIWAQPKFCVDRFSFYSIQFCPRIQQQSKAKPVIYGREMWEQGTNKLRNLFPGFGDIREGVPLRRGRVLQLQKNPIHIVTPLPTCPSLDEWKVCHNSHYLNTFLVRPPTLGFDLMSTSKVFVWSIDPLPLQFGFAHLIDQRKRRGTHMTQLPATNLRYKRLLFQWT